MLVPILALFLGCGENTAPEPQMVAPKAAKRPTAAAAANAVKAERQIENQWGALFWRNAIAWKVGGGDIVVGPKTSASLRTSGEPLVCEGVAAKGTNKNGALVLPSGATAPEDRSSQRGSCIPQNTFIFKQFLNYSLCACFCFTRW